MGEFFPAAFAWIGTIFQVNRITLVRIVATLLLCAFLIIVTRKPKLVPSRRQSIGEMTFDFIRVQICEEVLGKQAAKKYVPLLTFMFLAIFAMNITGVVPLLNIASTSVVATPLIMAIIAWVAFVGAGIKSHGAIGFVRTSLFPAGVPWPVYILLTPVELLSTFILRPATLTIRLLANMIAGHMLLAVFFSMTSYLFFEASGAMKAVGTLSFAAGFAFTLFEIFVAALQAYLFTLLTAVYISLSRESH